MTRRAHRPRTAVCLALVAALATLGCTGAIVPGPADDQPPGAPGSPGAPRASEPEPNALPMPAGFDPGLACKSADAPVALELKRLSRAQVVHALEDFVSPLSPANQAAVIKSVQTVVDLLPQDASDKGGYTSFGSAVVQDHVDALFGIANVLGTTLAGHDAYVKELVAPCGAGSTLASLDGDACLGKFLGYYGRKAMRRPPTAAEIADWKTFYRSDGLASLLARLVLQPRFYYRLDDEGDRLSGTDGKDAAYRLTPYELLVKLTLLFWNAPPDDALYGMLPAVDLGSDRGLDQVLAYVLASPRAREGVRAFYAQWLQLDGVPSIKGNASPAFKTFTKDLGIDAAQADHRSHMIDEVLDLAENATLAGGGFDTLLTSTRSFARTPDLAGFYGVAPWDGSPDKVIAFPPDKPRAGLLTRAAMLLSGGEYTRPIIRGKRVRTQILCESIPDPPANAADFTTLESNVNKTMRQIVAEKTSVPGTSCIGCHQFINPPGFLLEGYDSLGRSRTTEMKFDTMGRLANQLPVDDSATMTLNGQEHMMKGGVELSQQIASGGQGHLCLARNFFRYAHGRQEDDALDACSLQAMWKKAFVTQNGLVDMMRELTRAMSFRARKVL